MHTNNSTVVCDKCLIVYLEFAGHCSADNEVDGTVEEGQHLEKVTQMVVDIHTKLLRGHFTKSAAPCLHKSGELHVYYECM